MNIKGLLVDLRNNGGGSLKTVVDMVGMFIKNGPVVQVKYPDNDKQILYDRDRSIEWEGPLVNCFSICFRNHGRGSSRL